MTNHAHPSQETPAIVSPPEYDGWSSYRDDQQASRTVAWVCCERVLGALVKNSTD